MNIHCHSIHSDRALYDAQYLRPLEQRDRGFGSRLDIGYCPYISHFMIYT
jgi:hypothetical protein